MISLLFTEYVLLIDINKIFGLFSLLLGGPIIATKIPAPNEISMAHILFFVIALLIINSYVVSKYTIFIVIVIVIDIVILSCRQSSRQQVFICYCTLYLDNQLKNNVFLINNHNVYLLKYYVLSRGVMLYDYQLTIQCDQCICFTLYNVNIPHSN